MRLAAIAIFALITACGSGGFSSKTETESRPRKVVSDGDLHVDDGSGVLTADAEGADDGSAKGADADKSKSSTGANSPWANCPGYDQELIDKLIASGQPFEVECELEIEVGDDD